MTGDGSSIVFSLVSKEPTSYSYAHEKGWAGKRHAAKSGRLTDERDVITIMAELSTKCFH